MYALNATRPQRELRSDPPRARLVRTRGRNIRGLRTDLPAEIGPKGWPRARWTARRGPPKFIECPVETSAPRFPRRGRLRSLTSRFTSTINLPTSIVPLSPFTTRHRHTQAPGPGDRDLRPATRAATTPFGAEPTRTRERSDSQKLSIEYALHGLAGLGSSGCGDEHVEMADVLEQENPSGDR